MGSRKPKSSPHSNKTSSLLQSILWPLSAAVVYLGLVSGTIRALDRFRGIVAQHESFALAVNYVALVALACSLHRVPRFPQRWLLIRHRRLIVLALSLAFGVLWFSRNIWVWTHIRPTPAPPRRV
jgi:hypothetical protein